MRFIAAIIIALAMTTPSAASELSGRLYNVVEGSEHKSALDAPFVAPPRAELKRFPKQLDQAVRQLPSAEKEQMQEALAFLVVALRDAVTKGDTDKARSISDRDLQAKALAHLYKFAEKLGPAMTLREYLLLADGIKKAKPELWAQFQEFKHRNQEGK